KKGKRQTKGREEEERSESRSATSHARNRARQAVSSIAHPGGRFRTNCPESNRGHGTKPEAPQCVKSASRPASPQACQNRATRTAHPRRMNLVAVVARGGVVDVVFDRAKRPDLGGVPCIPGRSLRR